MENNLYCPSKIPLKCLSPVIKQIVNKSSKKVMGETIMKGDTIIFTWNSIVKISEIFEECSKQIQGHTWRNIQKMKINFALTTWINTQQLKILCSALRQLSGNLVELELRFDESAEILDEGLESLGCCIGRHVSNLKRVAIVFLGYKNTTSVGLNRFTFEISRNLVNLKSLELTLSCKNDSYEQDINNPQTLTDGGLKQMGALICHNAQNLVELALEFRNCSVITSKGLGSLGLEIGRHLLQLKKLYLSFFKCENIEDHEFESIGRNLLKHTSYLNSLKLEFCGCEGISDLGVKALGFAIWPYSKKLESLIISLLGCINVSQQSKDNLCRLAFSIPKFELRI